MVLYYDEVKYWLDVNNARYLKRRLSFANIVINCSASRFHYFKKIAVKKIRMFSDKYERSYEYRKQKEIEMEDNKHWKVERKSLFK